MALAKELSRTFDTARGVVISNVQDEFGNVSPHTIYLDMTADVNAAVAQIISNTDTNTAAIKAKLIAAGWQPTP